MEVFAVYRVDETKGSLLVHKYVDEADALAEIACNKVQPSVVLKSNFMKAKIIADDSDRFTEFFIHVFDDAECRAYVSRHKACDELINLVEWDDGEPSIPGYEFTICQRDAGTDITVENWFDRNDLKQAAVYEDADRRANDATWRE